MSFLAGIGAAMEESGRIGLEEIKEKRRQEAADALADKNHMRSLERLGMQHQYGMESAATKREWSLEDAETAHQQDLALEGTKQAGRLEMETLKQSGRKSAAAAKKSTDDPMARFSVKDTRVTEEGDEITDYVDPNTGEYRSEAISANRQRFQQERASGQMKAMLQQTDPSQLQAKLNSLMEAGKHQGAKQLVAAAKDAGISLTLPSPPKSNKEKIAERNERIREEKAEKKAAKQERKQKQREVKNLQKQISIWSDANKDGKRDEQIAEAKARLEEIKPEVQIERPARGADMKKEASSQKVKREIARLEHLLWKAQQEGRSTKRIERRLEQVRKQAT